VVGQHHANFFFVNIDIWKTFSLCIKTDPKRRLLYLQIVAYKMALLLLCIMSTNIEIRYRKRQADVRGFTEESGSLCAP